MSTEHPTVRTINPFPGGFTLLELLVAMALLVIISGALYSTYFTLVRGRETATAGMESRRELRTTLDMLRRELTAVYYKRGNRPDNKKFFHFIVEDRDFFGKPASTLDFTTISPPSGGSVPLSDQMAVSYRPVEQDEKIVLTRQVQDVYLTTEPLPYPQMEVLEGFLVECSPDGVKWVRSWDDALNSPPIPKYIRVTITLKEGEKVVNFTATASPRMIFN
jgi:general secretion pathway protein J